MHWKHLLESASESVNADLRLPNAYLVTENRMLRNQIDGRVQLIDTDRKELAEIGVKLGRKAVAEIATVAQSDTILTWRGGEIRRQYSTRLADALIAATALIRNLPLLTRNLRHFTSIDGRVLRSPTTAHLLQVAY